MSLLTVEKWITEGPDLPPSGSRFVGVSELDKAFLLSILSLRAGRHGDPLLAVFSKTADARNAVDNLRFWLGGPANKRVHYVPPVDFDYYRGLLPRPEVLCERNSALFFAHNDPKGRIFITSIAALVQKIFPPTEFERSTIQLAKGAEIDREALIARLLEAGYQRQPACYDAGIFAVRGGVIDVFCPLYLQPIRVELYGDTIDELRFFDSHSQRSLESLSTAFVIPVGQTLIPRGDAYEMAAQEIKTRLDHLGIPKTQREEVLGKILEGNISMELSLLFPLLSRGSASIASYFPPKTNMVWDGLSHLKEVAFTTELPQLEKNFTLFEKQPSPIAAKESLFLSRDELNSIFQREPFFSFEAFSSGEENEMTLNAEPINFSKERENIHLPGTHALEGFAVRFRSWIDSGYRIQIVSHTRVQSERIESLFSSHGFPSTHHAEGTAAFPEVLSSDPQSLNLWQGTLSQSRAYPMLGLVVLSEEEIFGHKKRVAKSTAWTSKDSARMLSSFRDLKTDDFVVHRDFGIGRYLGLKSMDFSGCSNDYVLLEYKDGDKLYIPVYRLNVLQKYAGGEGQGPALDKLGGERWAKAKIKARRAIAELAAEFLEIQARRRLIPAHAYKETTQEYHHFEAEFPFDETPDQMRAIDEVMADLSRPYPMDRLICGDVGYGKTEVAMRAAYRVAIEGKQVAVLVPTTVLAFQHFENFKKRFKSTAVRVEMVSRLRSSAEVKKNLKELSEGKIDIIIGTHRLLSSDIGFKDLGLIVVDEEHRFGVVHKERLKKLSKSVHFLSMTATPIPRTLNMAMTGIKDISVITTPPLDRLSVRTFVCRNEREVIAEAINNELSREGQVFFVHNRVESIFKLSQELKKLFPKIKIEVAHGQMEGDVLEKKMLNFYAGKADVLLTTAIIESGLDIPRANTIVIDQAHHFGLAQLYQLRGRVGRSERRAYCYLLVPPEAHMSTEAKERLQVIQRYSDLGSGFQIASHDLEIRGAGDLLGKDQSGHLAAIGVDLYFELLEETMAELRGQGKKTDIEPEISMKIAASFPNDYLPDISERIQLYRRLSGVDKEEDISEVESEIRDRFGPLPDEVVNLLGLMRLKILLKKMHVVRMSVGPKRTSLQFAPTTPIRADRLVHMVQYEDPDDRYALTPDQKLVFAVTESDWKSQLRELEALYSKLTGDAPYPSNR